MIHGLETSRYRVEDLGMSMRISIPARKNLFILIFIGVWLTGWLFGGLFSLGILFSSVSGLLARIFGINAFDFIEFDDGMGPAFAGSAILVFLALWAVAGYAAGRIFIWQLAGKEVIEVSSTGIRLSRPIFGFGNVKVYYADEIADVRLLRRDEATGKKVIAGLNQLVFDYEFNTVEFGGGLTPGEAEGILEEITTRYRQYAPDG